MAKRRSATPRRSRVGLALVSLVALVAVALCALSVSLMNCSSATRKSNQVTLNVAYSPEKQQLFEELVRVFSDSKPRLGDGKRLQVVASSVSPEDMVAASGDNVYQAISPDSSIWLAEIDRQWAAKKGAEATLVGETTRYMISPVVIAMWQDVAKTLGYPGKDPGWEDLLRTAAENPQFQWSHPSTNTASGLLATLAMFYAGAGITRGLTEQDATAQATLDYVARIEKTVKHYGEGELAVIQQVEQGGRAFLDAFVVQEQLVILYNMRHGGELVAIYPREGTLWEDHPLALLEHPDLTLEQRLAYSQFKRFLLSKDVQMRILRAGYRPADLTIRLDLPESPITEANGVDPSRPYTTLQVPSASVIAVVKNVWQYTKRKTNIYLIADVSGSMQGTKIEDAKVALSTFLDQIAGEQERIGLVAFSSNVYEVQPLGTLAQGRQEMAQSIENLSAGGNTALLDAIDLAVTKLQDLDDTERINAIVVMTDGKENASRTNLNALTEKLRRATQSEARIVVFCIAYGRDADMKMLETISNATGGFSRRGDPETIKNLYKTLSSYF